MSSVPTVAGEDREMRQAFDRARAIVTAMAQGLTQAELTAEGMAMAGDLIDEVEAEFAAMEDREAAAIHAGQLVQAFAHLAVYIAQMPAAILHLLEEEGIEVPPAAVARFGDAQRTVATAFMLAEMETGE